MAEELEGEAKEGKEKEVNPELVDERGVSWKNVAKETQRKLDAFEAEMASLKTQVAQAQANGQEKETDAVDPEELVKIFVKDPLGFVGDVVNKQIEEKERLQAQTRAVEYIQSQKDYDPKNDSRVLAIVSEYGLMGLSPIERAKSAVRILRREDELLAQSQKRGEEDKRTKEIKAKMGEGVGRATPSPETAKKREELLVKISSTDNAHQMAEYAAELREL